jgi:predicted DNA-binding transcriptional regulator AlpA
MDTIPFEVRFLRVAEVAAIYGVCTTTIWNWCSQGKFPEPKRFGRNTRWFIEDIRKWESETGFLADSEQSTQEGDDVPHILLKAS